jgi:hypothetical protein
MRACCGSTGIRHRTPDRPRTAIEFSEGAVPTFHLVTASPAACACSTEGCSTTQPPRSPRGNSPCEFVPAMQAAPRPTSSRRLWPRTTQRQGNLLVGTLDVLGRLLFSTEGGENVTLPHTFPSGKALPACRARSWRHLPSRACLAMHCCRGSQSTARPTFHYWKKAGD